MLLKQNHIEHLTDLVSRGLITAEQFNVEKVKIARVQLVTSKLPAVVRKALNAAVKRGELAHVKKDGHKPEAYWHPQFEYLAKQARNEHERRVLDARAGVLANRSFDDENESTE